MNVPAKDQKAELFDTTAALAVIQMTADEYHGGKFTVGRTASGEWTIAFASPGKTKGAIFYSGRTLGEAAGRILTKESMRTGKQRSIQENSLPGIFSGTPRTKSGKLVNVDAHRSDEEPSRIARLLSVIALLEKESHYATVSNLDSLYDHKGGLYIEWKTPPTSGMKNGIVRAWEEQGEHEIHHHSFTDGATDCDYC